MPLDPARWSAAVDAVAGGFFYGFYKLMLLPFSGRSTDLTGWLRAFLTLAAAMATGAIAAFFLTPALTALLPWPAARDPQAVGFAVGLFAWELTGSVLAIARARLRRLETQP